MNPREHDRRRFLIAVNTGAGAQMDTELEALLKTRIPADQLEELVMLQPDQGLEQQLCELVARCRTSGAILVVAGGDGTLNTALRALSGQPVTLGVIPRGTFNYFARDRGIPEQPEAAIEVLLHGCRQSFSLARVNGHPFCVSASLGVYPKIIAAREQVSALTGRNRLVSLLSGVWVFLTRARGRRLLLQHDGHHRTATAPMLLASVSPAQLESFDLPEVRKLEEGWMLVFVMRSDSLFALVRYLWASIKGRLRHLEQLEYFLTHELRVTTRRRHLTLAIDGELRRLSTPLTFSLQPDGFSCLVPERESACE